MAELCSFISSALLNQRHHGNHREGQHTRDHHIAKRLLQMHIHAASMPSTRSDNYRHRFNRSKVISYSWFCMAGDMAMIAAQSCMKISPRLTLRPRSREIVLIYCKILFYIWSCGFRLKFCCKFGCCVFLSLTILIIGQTIIHYSLYVNW